MATLVVLGVLAGCGKPAVLDVDRSEVRIRERLAETYDVTVDTVTCPDEVEVEEGATFTCRAEVGDGRVEVDVRQTDGEGTLEVEARAAILSTPRVEADIAATLADRFARDDVTVTCDGPAVRIEEPEATFACEAVDGDETREVEVRVRDARGALAYTLR
ncbi:DUF4333 domain-containing protein [Iamia sp. SCSIO 61187]|uniref:DUF4333 domain-containing protein n=1 Tax=Iamia sp. SCSIO 61187 TaxID=2722752 RepID=UPI001C630C04|nr:DUF4333 domain-containing protein [Iamia sp. SCSIO 61187]QYG93865.1 DUF4333 domain-containing protein [Iamia sp. SCSIO 61187]